MHDDILQFAVIEAFGRENIISAYESSLIDRFRPETGMTVVSDLDNLAYDKNDLAVCYGKFICQPDFREAETVPDSILSNRDAALFCFTGEDVAKQTVELGLFAYADIKLYERDRLGNIPFAALVYGEQKAMNAIRNNQLDNEYGFSLECTYRRPEEVWVNIFNRIGIFAVKFALPVSDGVTLTRENWTEWVNEADVLEAADSIR